MQKRGGTPRTPTGRNSLGIEPKCSYTSCMKYLLLSALCLSTSSAFASFELAILTDATGFHRFDAETGIYLGVFGEGRVGSVVSTWANQSASRFYAMDSRGIQSFDYSTGEYLGYVNYGAVNGYATNDTNGDFVSVSGSNTISRYSLSGVDSTFTLPTGTTARWISLQTDGKWYVGDSSNTGRILRSVTGSLSSGWTVVATGLSNIAAVQQNAVACPTPGVAILENMIITHDGSSTKYYGFNSSYTYTTTSTFGLSTTTRNGIARGHQGQYHLGLISAGVSQVRNFDDAGYPGSTWTTSIVSSPRAMTVVLAPEPGTIAALGAGLAFLARKRKSRAGA